MVRVVDVRVESGYTSYDHLIDSGDLAAVQDVIGREFTSVKKALATAERAFLRSCDSRVSTARVRVAIVSDRRYPDPVWIG